jgi:hypothetical protein
MMTTTGMSADGKADFTDLYHRPDPRSYYRTLGALEYQIPQRAAAIFAAVRRAQRETVPTATGTVLDVCCSYGVNATLLRTDLAMAEVYHRYAGEELADLEPEQLADLDRQYYAEHQRSDAPRVLGLDIAAEAVAYAREVGLLSDGWAENLEESDPSASLTQGIQDVSLMTITGGVGYVTERTFGRLMQALPQGRAPWVAAFVLRMYPYDSIAETLAESGLVTERLDGVTFPQRRFESADEQEAALRQLHSVGIDTKGLEDEGWYHCTFFLSRPAEDIAKLPLEQLLDTYRS